MDGKADRDCCVSCETDLFESSHEDSDILQVFHLPVQLHSRVSDVGIKCLHRGTRSGPLIDPGQL